MWRFGLIVLIVQGAHGAFFDLTDIDDPLALLWNTKDSIVGPKNKECTVNTQAGPVTGVCKHKTHCLLTGGHALGHCGVLSTCCSYLRTCSRKTRSKVSYFSSGAKPSGDCDYTIELENANICQVRLDFEIFRLSAPTADAIGGTVKCITDALTVHPHTYNIPPLCGNNNEQHVYVHLHSATEVKLHVRLADRVKHPRAVSNPVWRIKVTQLECPGPKSLLSKHDYPNEIPDFDQLAPAGAIQYYTAKSGRFRSFGYYDGQSTYISGLNYAIAFKRTPEVNCVAFTPNYISLRQNPVMIPTDADCIDYLFIPELDYAATSTPADFRYRLCLSATPTLPYTFYSHPPGPFTIHFVSDPTNAFVTGVVNAFDLNYELTTC